MTTKIIIVLAVVYVVVHAINAFMARRDRTKESYETLLREIKTVEAMLYRRLAQESHEERVEGYMQAGLYESDARTMADQISDYQRDLPKRLRELQ